MTYFQNIYHSDLGHRARSIYMYLKNRADGENRRWPGIRTIATELGFPRSTVRRTLGDLYGADPLTREPRWRENGSLSLSLYRLV